MDTAEARPRWFMAAAILAFLFMLVGVAGFAMTIITDPSTLPVQQRELMLARPAWMKIAYALAVWSGLAGALLLLLRRRMAEPLLLLSLVTAVLTFVPYVTVPAVRDSVGPSDEVSAVIVVILVALSFLLAWHARRRGWLR